MLENSWFACRIPVSEAKSVSCLQFYNEIQTNIKEWHICFLKGIPQACPKPAWLSDCVIVCTFCKYHLRLFVSYHKSPNLEQPPKLSYNKFCFNVLKDTLSNSVQWMCISLQQRSTKHHLHKGETFSTACSISILTVDCLLPTLHSIL